MIYTKHKLKVNKEIKGYKEIVREVFIYFELLTCSRVIYDTVMQHTAQIQYKHINKQVHKQN